MPQDDNSTRETAASARETIRRNLIKYIKLSGLSKSEIARRLGINRVNITNWTAGKTFPDVERIAELCDIFGRLPSDFFYPTDDVSEPTETEGKKIRTLVDAFLSLDEEGQDEILKTVKKRAKKSR